MNVLHVWDGDYPWDIRVDKISQSLTAQGHQVHIACRNKAAQPAYEAYRGYHIHRMPTLSFGPASLNVAYGFPAFFNPTWIRHIDRICTTNRCDAIIVRDLPLAITASWVAKRHNIPCILDMAECYPELLRCIWTFEKKRFSNIFLRNPLLADAVESYALSRMDRIWVMIEESRDRLIEKGIDPSRIDIISNTPVISRFNQSAETPRAADAPLNMIYVGLLNPSRGLDTALHGVAKYVEKFGSAIQFSIVGAGKAEDELKKLSRELGLEKYVTFHGWVDNQLVPDLIAKADIGIVPHHKCSHWDTTIPNKLFDYMASAKPVVVSNATPIARIVQSENVGVVYTDFNADELADGLAKLSHASTRAEMANNGRTAITERYNWSREENLLREAMLKL